MTRRAMALIEEENYAEAQWYWVTNNMKEPSTPGLHDWWSAVGDHATSIACTPSVQKKFLHFTLPHTKNSHPEIQPLPGCPV
jgi:hypothetical protein